MERSEGHLPTKCLRSSDTFSQSIWHSPNRASLHGEEGPNDWKDATLPSTPPISCLPTGLFLSWPPSITRASKNQIAFFAKSLAQGPDSVRGPRVSDTHSDGACVAGGASPLSPTLMIGRRFRNGGQLRREQFAFGRSSQRSVEWRSTVAACGQRAPGMG